MISRLDERAHQFIRGGFPNRIVPRNRILRVRASPHIDLVLRDGRVGAGSERSRVVVRHCEPPCEPTA